MPNIISGSGQSNVMAGGKISYTYPGDKDFSPSSAVAKKIVGHIMELARESANTMSQRHGYWNSIDNTLNCYIKLDDEETKIKNKDERKPVSIVFPHSYALLETTLSYLCSTFFKDPLFRYRGTTVNDMVGGSLLELLSNSSVQGIR